MTSERRQWVVWARLTGHYETDLLIEGENLIADKSNAMQSAETTLKQMW